MQTEELGGVHRLILTTTQSGWADDTLLSRFHTVQFAALPVDVVANYLQSVCQRENLRVDYRLLLDDWIADRKGNLRLCLNDLELEAAA